MPNPINVREARMQLSRLLDRAHAGEEVVLSKAGKPYAKLVPLEKSKRTLGFIKGYVDDRFFEPLPKAELGAWERQ
jgi:prevent-host-death family protein